MPFKSLDLSKRRLRRRGRPERRHQLAQRQARPAAEGNDAGQARKLHTDKSFRGDQQCPKNPLVEEFVS